MVNICWKLCTIHSITHKRKEIFSYESKTDLACSL